MRGIMIVGTLVVLSGFFVAFNATKNPISDYEVDIQIGFPDLEFPEGNALTQARVELGRMLFYDPILSVDSTISCANCHNQALAFADDDVISPGVEGRLAMRNAPTLANVGYNPTLLFDGFLKTLEMQVLVPIQEHAEFSSNIVDIANKLKIATLVFKFNLNLNSASDHQSNEIIIP